MGNEGLLFERDGETSAISTALSAASTGSGGVLVIQGRAGIGKSRLLDFARDAADRGMTTLSAQGAEIETAFAFGVVKQLFDAQVRDSQIRGADLLEGAAKQAAPVFGFSEVPHGDSSFAVLHGLYWLTADICQRNPTVLCIDDVQWADVPSLRYVLHLLPRISALPLAVIIGMRTMPADSEHDMVATIRESPNVMRIEPRPLSRNASREFARALIGDDLDERAAAMAYEISRGNPLLLRELLTMADDRALFADPGDPEALPRLGSALIGGRIARQWDRIDPRVRQFAIMLSALAEPDVGLGALMAGVSLQDANRFVDQLITLDILYRADQLRFVHPLIATAIYDSATVSERGHAHSRAAQVLAQTGAGDDKVAPQLLRASQVDDIDIAAVLHRAADRAEIAGSPEVALDYLHRMLSEPLDPSTQRDTFVRMGRLCLHVDADRAGDYLQAAIDLSSSAAERAEVADLLANVRVFQDQGHAAVEIREKAITELGADDLDIAQRLAAGIGSALLYGTTPERFHEHADAWRSAPPTDGPGGRLLDAFIALHDMMAGINRDDVIVRSRRALDASGTSQIPLAHASWTHAVLALSAANLGDVVPHVDAGLAAAYRTGSRFSIAAARLVGGLMAFFAGDLTQAEAWLREGLEAADATGKSLDRPVASILANVLVARGAIDEAMALLDYLSVDDHVPDHGVWWWFLNARAEALYHQRRWHESIASMRACGRNFSAHGCCNPELIPWRSGLALGLLRTGEQDEARELINDELRIARGWGSPRSLGRALRRTAAFEDGDTGIDLLRESLAMLEPSAARFEYAKTAYALGSSMSADGYRADAAPLFAIALDGATTCGSPALADKAIREMRRLGLRPRRSAMHGIDSLTPSERRVVDLARDGMTNREIAQELFVTTKTVETHLAAAYRKLRIRGRAELVG